ncbi:FmdB family zinc ribbon protein [Candidatus Nitrospira bockiana]
MPLYEYRCEACQERFEINQSITARAEDTVCPHCRAQKATRLMSAFASKIVGDHKPGFSEMKAYDMQKERLSKFSKLPPAFGKRTPPPPVSDLFTGNPTPKNSGSGSS